MRPIPEIPFPNDYALRLDLATATGRRINISTSAPTEVESEFRRRAATLDGFGTFAPITVRFDAPLDLANLAARHVDNDDLTDDAVYVFDITPGSPSYGQPVRLDFGRGWLPATVMDADFYGRQGLKGDDPPQIDPHDGTSSVVFETRDEDADGNGQLDPGEDGDGDGVLDVPNIFPLDGNQWDDLLTFYERETNTLILRPVRPLRTATRYAVVLTDRLIGTDGSPVRSPFPWVSLATQTDALEDLGDMMLGWGLGLEDVGFVWTFTTQSATQDLEAIRAGLYGHGALGWLRDAFEPGLTLVPLRSEGVEGSVYVISGDDLLLISDLLGAQFGLAPEVAADMKESYAHISHLVVGEYTSPTFLVDKDGHAAPGYPSDDDEAFELDARAGTATVAPYTVAFLCTVPKPTGGLKQPFPVTLKTNGTGVPKLGLLGYAGYHAKQGLAACSIDAFGHGFALSDGLRATLQPVVEALGFAPILPALIGPQVRDLDNDGVGDSGVDFWSPDPFHSRDTIRQTVVDWMQLVRLLRSFDGERRGTQDLDGDGALDVLGDWDGDGVPDLGTEDGLYSAWGVSLGGIVTGVLAGIEAKLSAAVPQSGGGGLTDIAVRSLQSGVPQMVLFGSWGPFVMGRPDPDGETSIELMIPHFTKVRLAPFAVLHGVMPGDRVTLTNLDTGELNHATVSADGGFRLSVQADALMPSELRAVLKLDPTAAEAEPVVVMSTPEIGNRLRVCVESQCVDRFEQDVEWAGVVFPAGQPLVAVSKGLGRDRQTPDFRRLLSIAQAVIDPADPATWARHYHEEPLDYSYDPGVVPGCNVLDLLTIGDENVPVAAGITLARAAGIVDATTMDSLARDGVVEGNWRLARYRADGSGPHAFDPGFDPQSQGAEAVLFDPDDLDQGADGSAAPSPAAPLRATVSTPLGGKAGLRILYVSSHGSHGLLPADPRKDFPVERYGLNLITRYMVTGGQDLVDDVCLADSSCEFFAP